MKLMIQIRIGMFTIYIVNFDNTTNRGPWYIELLFAGMASGTHRGLFAYSPHHFLHILGWTFKGL